jgi:hypothetical protein
VIARADEMDARYGEELSMTVQERVARCLGTSASRSTSSGGKTKSWRCTATSSRAGPPPTWSTCACAWRVRCIARASPSKQAGDAEAALESYARLLGRDGYAKDATLQLWVAKAMIDQASVLGQQGDQAGRAEVYRTLIARFGERTDAPMRERVINASEWLADAYGLLGQHEQQYTTIRDTLRRFGTQMPEAQKARLSHRLGPMTLGRFARKLIDRVKGAGR